MAEFVTVDKGVTEHCGKECYSVTNLDDFVVASLVRLSLTYAVAEL